MLAVAILAIALLGIIFAARDWLDGEPENFTTPVPDEEDVDWRHGAPGWSRPGRAR